MAENKNSKTSAGGSDLIILGVIVVVLLCGMGLIAVTLFRGMSDDSGSDESEAEPAPPAKTVKTKPPPRTKAQRPAPVRKPPAKVVSKPVARKPEPAPAKAVKPVAPPPKTAEAKPAPPVSAPVRKVVPKPTEPPPARDTVRDKVAKAMPVAPRPTKPATEPATPKPAEPAEPEWYEFASVGKVPPRRVGHRVQVWRAPDSFSRRGRYEVSIRHGAAGRHGAFHFTVWTDKNRDGIPDTRIGESDLIQSNTRDRWSQWQFDWPGGALFVGNCWSDPLTVVHYLMGPQETRGAKHTTLYYSRARSGIPVGRTSPRAAPIRIRRVPAASEG